MTAANFSANTESNADYVEANLLFRGMGKSITVVSNSSPAMQIEMYRLVQQQIDESGSSEGADNAPFYVKVWDSNGSGVAVVRTG